MSEIAVVDARISKLLKLNKKASFEEFSSEMELIKGPVNISKFFLNISNKVPLYLDSNLIDTFGYEGKTSIQKKHIVELLKRNHEDGKGWSSFNNSEYEKHYNKSSDIEKSLYVHPSEFKKHGMNRTTHYIMSARVYKDLLIMTETDKAKKIRNYFLDLEELVKDYRQYCHDYEDHKNKQLITKNKNIILNQKNNINQLVQTVNRLESKIDSNC